MMKGWKGWNRFSRGQARQQPVHAAVGRRQDVVEPGVNPALKVLPAPVGINVRRPCHGQRVHSELGFEHMGGIEAVLAAGARDDAVVPTIGAPITVAQIGELALAHLPVDAGLLLGHPAGVADAVVVEVDGGLLGFAGMPKLDRRVGALVGDDAALAKADGAGQAIPCPCRVAGVLEGGGVESGGAFNLFHRLFEFLAEIPVGLVELVDAPDVQPVLADRKDGGVVVRPR